jgi:hypothetical protein
MRLLLALTAAAILGATTSHADAIAGALTQTGASRALSMALNAGSTWAIFAIAVGWWIGRPVRGPIGAALALSVATVAYYAYGVGFGDRADPGSSGVVAAGSRWVLAALLIGPVLGSVGVIARSSARLGAAVCWAPVIGMGLELSVRHGLNLNTFAIDPWLGWTQIGMLAGAGILSVALFVERRRSGGRSAD